MARLREGPAPAEDLDAAALESLVLDGLAERDGDLVLLPSLPSDASHRM
jgi:hypothetical protein